MIPLGNNHGYRYYILSLMVIGALCLMPLSVCVAEDSPSPQFVKVKSVHIDYDKVPRTEMVKNGSKVFIEVVLINFSKVIEGNKSELFFYSDLGVQPSIIVDGMPSGYKAPFVVDHRTVKEIKVTLSGDAPEVNKRKENVTLLNITQKIKEEKYSVIEIKRDVSSRAIEDALNMWHEANATIAKANKAIIEAEEAGINVADAKKSLELANEYLNNSRQYYNEGRPEDALVEAEKARDSAKEAEYKVKSAVGGRTFTRYAIIAIIVVIAIVAVVLLLQQRQRRRGVY